MSVKFREAFKVSLIAEIDYGRRALLGVLELCALLKKTLRLFRAFEGILCCH